MAGGGQPFESIVRPRVGLTAGKGVNGVLSAAVERMAEARPLAEKALSNTGEV